MKKMIFAAMLLFCVGGTVMAQNAPKQQPPKQEKKEAKKQNHVARHHVKTAGHKDTKKTNTR